jgi:hypothetical protein
MLMMSNVRYKKPLIVVFCLLLFVGVIIFLNEQFKDSAPPILRAMYPYFHMEKLDGPDHYTFGNNNGFEFDFYAREVTIGNTPFYVVAENGSEDTSRYMFLGIKLDPELLIEVEKAPHVASAQEAFEENIFQVDITGDGQKEVFVRTLSDAGYMTYTILRTEGESLKEIDIDLGFSDWTNIKYVGFEDNAVLFSHNPEGNYDETAFGKYYVVGDELISERDIEQRKQTEAFIADLKEALEDPKWTPLAVVFDENCEIHPGSVLQPQQSLFRSMVENMDPIKTTQIGEKIYIIPCMLHAYQSSEIGAIYDGVTYEPIRIEMMDYEGNRSEEYSTVGLYYNPDQDIFTSYAKGRGMGDCGAGSEFKLIGKTLVLQKMEADKECDGEYKSEVVFDISD